MLRLAIGSLALALALAPGAAPGAEDGAASAASEPVSATSSAGKAPSAPVYRLPKVGKPRGRIGGGRRGPIAGVADVHALVPDHVGQTASAQPSFYWYLGEPIDGDVILELTLVDETSIDPLVDRRLERPASPGVQRVRLSDLGVTLEPGQEYEWSVAIVPDPQDHSKDVVASGWVQRVPVPDELSERLAAAGPEGAAAVYGEAGLWYDMLDAAFERILSSPDSQTYREQVAAVLEQTGLPGDAARQP